jgi:hypothetical protein
VTECAFVKCPAYEVCTCTGVGTATVTCGRRKLNGNDGGLQIGYRVGLAAGELERQVWKWKQGAPDW